MERVDLVDELTRRDGLPPLAQDELALRVRELAAARLVQDRQDLLRLVALDEDLEERVGQSGEAVRVRTEALEGGWGGWGWGEATSVEGVGGGRWRVTDRPTARSLTMFGLGSFRGGAAKEHEDGGGE